MQGTLPGRLIERNPEHRYDLESYGLSREMLLERHADYIERFGLAA